MCTRSTIFILEAGITDESDLILAFHCRSSLVGPSIYIFIVSFVIFQSYGYHFPGKITKKIQININSAKQTLPPSLSVLSHLQDSLLVSPKVEPGELVLEYS